MASKYILTIDDSESARGVIDLTLSDKGYAVGNAATGEDGLQSIKKKIPDLIILDVDLPDVTGTQLCQMLKNDPDLRYIPILMCTCHRTPEVGLKGGADDYISKPFKSAELVERVNALLRRVDLAEHRVREKIASEHASLPAAQDAAGAASDQTFTTTIEPTHILRTFQTGEAAGLVWNSLIHPLETSADVTTPSALLPLALFCILQALANLVDPNVSSRILATLQGLVGPVLVWAFVVGLSLAALPAEQRAGGLLKAASLCAAASSPLVLGSLLGLLYGLITDGTPSEFSGSPLLLIARIAPNSIAGFWMRRLDLFELWSGCLLTQGFLRLFRATPPRAVSVGAGCWILWSLAKAAAYFFISGR